MITAAKIVNKNKENLVIQWEGDSGFGTLSLVYKGNGRFELDSEYMMIDTILEILKKAEEA